MKSQLLTGIIGIAWLGVAAAQERELGASTIASTNNPPADTGTNGPAASASLLTPSDLRTASVQPLTDRVQTEGALTYLFSGTNLFEIPGRLWNLVVPSSSTVQAEPIRREGGLSSRPWTSIVGWAPGGSAFPDPTTHELSIGLFTFGGSP